jgi:hypothetical protein
VNKKVCLILSPFLIVCLFESTAHLCGPDMTFRAYLNGSFWQPFAKYEDSVVKAGPAKNRRDQVQAGNAVPQVAFAGFSKAPASDALSKVRKAYIAENYDEARAQLEEAARVDLSEGDREELRLIDAKLDLRIAENEDDKDCALLATAKQKLEAYVATSRSPALRSEARGWLARVHYLLREYPAAVKIYLDELASKETVFDKESLVASLHMIFPYNGSGARLADHLEEYFDTPAHALFVVYIVTNPVCSEGKERAAMAEAARNVIDALQRHSELFNGSDQSESLALAVMRASIYMGDTQSALLL